MRPEARTRFAPSPTGYLHLGHAFSALTAQYRAPQGFLLRIEDIDTARCRPEFDAAILEDLGWLGLTWPAPLRQSGRSALYQAALDRLAAAGLCYPCSCSRGDIRRALSAPQNDSIGPDGPVYPGTCRGRGMASALPGDAVRLNISQALAHLPPGAEFHETGEQPGWHIADAAYLAAACGDVVLARRGFGAAYHLAVVVDDAAQGITEVVRGADLFEATAIHVLLQNLLGFATPAYHHHRLIRDAAGKRLAKRDDARAIRAFRAEGATPQDIRAMVGL